MSVWEDSIHELYFSIGFFKQYGFSCLVEQAFWANYFFEDEIKHK